MRSAQSMKKIESPRDVKTVVAMMHDSEFTEADFGFDAEKERFFLKSYSPFRQETFNLQFHNVEKYKTVNLDKIPQRKATGGVFNYIKIRKRGLKLTLVSQDLRIVIEMSKLEGELNVTKE